jgi:hypothetical protein
MTSDDDEIGESSSQNETSLLRRRVLALAGASLTAGIAGCGGDGDGTPTPTPGTATDTPADTDTSEEETTTPTAMPGTDTPVQPLPEPGPLVSIDGTSVSAGGTTTLTGILNNPYTFPVQSIEVDLQAPGEEWTLTATGEVEFDGVESQGSRDMAWELTAPEDGSGEYTLEGTVRYETTTDSADVDFSTTVTVFTGDFGEGLSAHWSFESDTVSDGTVSDQSGNGNDGSIVGDPGVASGTVGDGLDFDGEDDWVQVEHSDSLQVQTDDFTLAGWVNIRESRAISQTRPLVSKKTDDGVGDDQIAYQLSVGGYPSNAVEGGPTVADAPTFVYADGNGNLQVSTTDESLSTDTWHHLAVSYDHENSTAEWYIDGEHVKNEELSGSPMTNEQEAFLGCHFDVNGDPSYALNGLLDDVRIYNEAKDATFIGELHAVGNPSE